MNKKIVTLTGPSCAGKTTMARALCGTGRYVEIVSFTSRAPRSGEVDGVDYYFKTPEECKALIDSGGAAESVSFSGRYYGIEKSEIETKLASDKTPIVVVEPNGLEQLEELYGTAVVPVYLTADVEVLLERFLARLHPTPSPDFAYEARRLQSLIFEKQAWDQMRLYYAVGFKNYGVDPALTLERVESAINSGEMLL